MKKLGLNPTEAEIEDMIRAAENCDDGNYDGKIDWHEFAQARVHGKAKHPT